MSKDYSATVDRAYEHQGNDAEILVQLDFGWKNFDIVFFEPGLSDAEYVNQALTVHRLESDPCDWNPDKNEPAWVGSEPHAFAEVMVGAKGKFRLCKSCAALQRFKKYRKREPIEYRCSDILAILADGKLRATAGP